MYRFIHTVTKHITTKKGMVITLLAWLFAVVMLSLFAPGSNEHSVNNVAQLYPDDSPSEAAQEKLDTYFAGDEGLPVIFVVKSKDETIQSETLTTLTKEIDEASVPYLKSVVPLFHMPPQALTSFISEDETAAFIPGLFEAASTSKEVKAGLEKLETIFSNYPGINIYTTGPAGIAVDATDLFSRADLVLLFSTVGIILILLILTYRSPLLAIIPLLAAGFVYAVVDRLLGLLGLSGVELAKQSLSIMMVLLFAVVIDYSLFIFSRFREELYKRNSKYEAMQNAIKEIGTPIFYSSSTILLAMLTLFVAKFGDYKNFAPIFSVAVVVVLVAALTLIPALFTLFGRKSFWPKIPQVTEESKTASPLWSKVGKFVSAKPIFSVVIMLLFLLLTSSQILQIKFEYNTMKSFPEDMPSRVGYEILEESFSKGNLATTTVIFEGKEAVTEEDQKRLADVLSDHEHVQSVRLTNTNDSGNVLQYDLIFDEDPYAAETMDVLEKMMQEEKLMLADANVQGDIYYAGETAASIDNRNVNKRDLIVIIILETIFIFSMLIFLTRSPKIAGLMMATILLSFVAALGIGTYLSKLLFGIDAISNRVPVYAFVFLVALGIDYNIFLVSRFLEEKKRLPVKEAVASALTHTGGVISSAGIILAATFGVLMTQPIEVLFVFGFIVAIGILMDTFLIRGVLLPGLLILFEKNEHLRLMKRKKTIKN